MKKCIRAAGVFVLLAVATPVSSQENPLVPLWKQRSADGEQLAPYTGKYCEFAAFEGVEFTFSADPSYQEYGFLHFSTTVGGVPGIPFSELAGKKAKIGRETSRAAIREVLVEDCSVVYLNKIGEIEADDAKGFGVTFAATPLTRWAIEEKVNPLTDAKSCHVTPEGVRPPYPMFFYHSKEGFSVGVVGGDFPGKPTTFRVDKLRAIAEVEGLSGQRAQALVAQIRAGGKSLLLGAYEWPDEVQNIREFNLSGLPAKLDSCKASVAR